jgi:hypothetical protein
VSRIPWTTLLALLIGIGAGLAYSWVFSPLQVVDSVPAALRSDFKDQYRSAIAAAYSSTGNLERARARLSLLGDLDPIQALNADAQRLLANGEFQAANQLALLSAALQGNETPFIPPATPTAALANITPTPPNTASAPEAISFPTLASSATFEFLPTQVVIIASTPRPTLTPIPTTGAPFELIAQESFCDSKLPDGLLQVLVLNANRRQLPGVEIRITWDVNEDRFFTGLKPELGNGYADFLMTPNITYAVQLAQGSDIATGLTAPSCQTDVGENYFGGFKLTFQQPK